MSKSTSLVFLTAALALLTCFSTGCRGLNQALGLQPPPTPTARDKAEETELDGVVLPFQVSTRMDQALATVPVRDTRVYRLTKKPTEAGFPVDANAYASARAIDVNTGEIVWIDTVNVRTRGVSETTGLERLGLTMAGNFAGTNTRKNAVLIFNGQDYRRPKNWDQVVAAYPKAIAKGSQLKVVRRRVQ